MIGLGIGLAFHSSIAAFVLAVFGAVMGHRLDTLHELPEEDPLLASFPEEEFREGLTARSRARSGDRAREFGGDFNDLDQDVGEQGEDRESAETGLDGDEEAADDEGAPDVEDSDEADFARASDEDDPEGEGWDDSDDAPDGDGSDQDEDHDDLDGDEADDAIATREGDDSDADSEVAASRAAAAATSRSSPAAPVPPRRPVQVPSPPALDLTTAACGVLVELARVDGDVNKDEIAVAREYFEQTLRYGPIALQKVRNELKAAMAQQRDVQPLAQSCRARLDARGRVTFLNALYQLALADGELRKSERDTLRLVARELGITEEAHRELTRAYFGDGSDQYALLGVDRDATDDELKSAFRRLAAEHHPDRFAHQGKAAVDAASERFRRLQEAYEELRRIRSF